MWFRTLLIWLLIFFAIRFVMRLVAGMVEGATAGSASRQPRQSPVKMVADPVCGTYVVPGKALQLARGGETFYFCSEQCRDNWAASR